MQPNMPEKRTHAGLEYYTFEGPKNPTKTIFLLHGFGASAFDLMPLKQVGGLEKLPFRWVFIQAPIAVPISSFEQGWAWFTLDLERLGHIAQAGDIEALGAWTPPGLKEVSQKVAQVVELECKEASQRVLGGFSQGAMTSLQAVLGGLRVSQLVYLSGSWTDAKAWTERIETLNKEKIFPKVFQSHGRYDSVLPFAAADHLHQVLKKYGASVEFYPFAGHHEIPMETISQLAQFLK